MVSVENPDLNSHKHLAVYAKAICIQTSLLVQTLNYNDIKRMVDISDEEVEAGDSPLAELIVEGLEQLETNNVRPIGSIASLFDRGDLQRSLKPRLYIGFHLRDGVSMVGALVTCLFTKDETLGTNMFTNQWCTTNKVPRLDARWSFIDIVASSMTPCGALLVLHAILAAARGRLVGVCAVAASLAGQRLLHALNFTCVPYRERGSNRHFCFLRLPQDLSFSHVKIKLRFEGDTQLVESVCWREALSARAKSSVVGRC